ncbi:type II toxin-antitoxin system ParD family antitoxin [Leucothrix pacifica]|uniref:Antitoxin ParD n=1 Tax=Leucothrix pacifica TaxID=1247513 RepID=A0A317C5G9_9GAMM|nr:type II toxin-antitoxin system ParD family antitoxin [Leucothrix pacifica]PWQ92613.1 type II toxin-antitoxin system ParD family antitoxin [Leucothrix pacifica]
MNVSLTPQLENFVKQKVEAGLYNSVSEVMREALRLLVEREEVKEMKLVALRRDLQEGIDSLDRGEGSPLDMNDIKAKARAIKASQA